MRRRTRGTNTWYRELWEPDLSTMREPVRFFKKYVCIWTGSLSCENLRSVFSPVLTLKVSIDSNCENRVENRSSTWEPPNTGNKEHPVNGALVGAGSLWPCLGTWYQELEPVNNGVNIFGQIKWLHNFLKKIQNMVIQLLTKLNFLPTIKCYFS